MPTLEPELVEADDLLEAPTLILDPKTSGREPSAAAEAAAPPPLPDLPVAPAPAAELPKPPPPARKQVAADPGASSVDWRPEPAPSAPSTEQAAAELVEQCEAQIARTAEPLRKGRLHYECARLLETPLSDLKRAGDHYLKARELLPEHIPTIRGARRVLIKQGKAKLALPLFDAEARLLKSPKRKAVVLYEKGLLLEDHMVQKKEAREAFLAALEFDENNPTLLKAVQRNQLHAAQWDGVERTLERTAHAVRADARHRAAVIAERARLVESRRHDREMATELYQSAFEVDPRAPGALSALKRLHLSHKRYKDLIAVLEKEVELVNDPTARGMALYRIGRTYVDWLGDFERGISALERAAREMPTDSVVLGELAVLYERVERFEALARVLEQLAQLSSSPTDNLVYLHRIGQICEENLGRADQAIGWYERALAVDPGFVPALAGLRRLYEKQGSWAALVTMHRNEADNALDPERRAAGYARVAEIMERHLGDKQEAISAHARALGVRPGYPASFKALVRLYSEAGMWRELAEIYERAVDQAEDTDTKIAYLFKIGRLHEDALGQASHAVTAYRRILELVRDHLGAIHAWQRAAERGGRYQELIEGLEFEAEIVLDKARQLALLERAAEVARNELGDPELALTKVKAVLKLDPNYGPGLRLLGDLQQSEGRWEDLLETYRLELRATPKGPQRAALLCKMGELTDHKLGRPQDAVRFYREAFEIDPRNLSAREALRLKLREAEQWEELVKLLKLELTEERDKERRTRIAYLIGDTYENRLDNPEQALAAYEEALTTSPSFRPAVDGKLRLLSERRDFKRLVDELAREAKEAFDPGAQIDAYLRMGEIWRDELGNPAQAIDCFRAVLERDPGHLGALLALESLYAAAGDQDGLKKVYTAQASVLQDVQARVAVLREFTRLETKSEADKAAVKQSYFSILQLAPTDATALSELEAVALEERDRQLLAHVDAKLGSVAEEASLASAYQTRLAEALESSGDPSALEMYRSAIAAEPDNIAAVRGLSRLAEQSDNPALLDEAAEKEARIGLDGARAARLLVRSAELRMSASEDVAGATKALERALELYPHHEAAARRLRDLMLTGGKVDDLIASLTQAAKSTEDVDRRTALWIHVAELMAEKKADIAGGIAALLRVVKSAPNHKAALAKLADLYARDRQWSPAAEYLNKVLALGPSDEEAVELNLSLAEILHEHLNEPERAMAALGRVLDIDAGNRRALRRLLDVQLALGKTAPAAETAARLVRASADREGRAEALGKLARLEEARGNPSEALDAYEQAVALGGAETEAAQRMKDFVSRHTSGGSGPWARYASALAKYVEQSGVPPEHLGVSYTELGRVQSQVLKQIPQAIATLERGLAGNPAHVEMRRELVNCLQQAGEFSRALGELRRVLDADVMRAQTWRDLVAVFEGLERHHEATLATGGLVSLGAATDAEYAAYQSRQVRPAMAHPGSLDLEAIISIDALGGMDARCDLLSTLADSLGKIHPPDLERYGLGARDKLGQRSSHPLRMLADRVAGAFGVSDFDLYVHRAHSGLPEVEFTDPVAVLIPEYVSNLGEPQQVFMIARVMANIARCTHAVDKLSPHQLEILLAAAARQADPSFGTGLADEEYLQSLAKRVYKSFPWLGRGRIEEAAALYLGANLLDINEWVRKVRLTAARAAVLLADDLPGPIDLVRRTEGDLAGLQGEALNQGIRMVHDLMRFWVSDPAFALRRRLGL